jgi:AbrB family looped-hinge helix DNA binding protein
MRITTKGQVTIPQDIRERLGLLPHSEVTFEIDGDTVRIRKARGATRGSAIVSRLRGSATRPMTTDEIMSLTRDY